MGRRTILWTLAALASSGCGDRPPQAKPEAPAIPSAVFEGLPLSGNLATALAAGFGNCLDATKGLRCRKDGVTVIGVGPLSAAVDLDLASKDRSARFDRVTLWHATDQGAVLDLRPALEQAGWQSCLTPDAERYWHPPSPLRIAIDTNYWGSRRVVISAPAANKPGYCSSTEQPAPPRFYGEPIG